VAVERLQAHFRRLVMARLPGQDGLLPLLRSARAAGLLPTCTEDELKLVFGPVDSFLLEGETPAEEIVSHRTRGRRTLHVR